MSGALRKVLNDQALRLTVPDDYERARKLRVELEAEASRAERALKALSGGAAATPDKVRASTDWRLAKWDFDTAFSRLRYYNVIFDQRFKRSRAL